VLQNYLKKPNLTIVILKYRNIEAQSSKTKEEYTPDEWNGMK